MAEPVLFLAGPDANYPTVERIEWLTDVQYGADGTEQRVQIRRLPRFTYRWTSTAAPGSVEEAALEGFRIPQVVRVPLWPHAVVTGNPTRGVSRDAIPPFDRSHPPILGDKWFGMWPNRSTALANAYAIPDPRNAGSNWNPWPQSSLRPWIVAPSAVGQLSVERSIEHRSPEVCSYDVEARLHPYYDADSQPDDSTTAAALALPPLTHDATVSILEDVRSDVNRFDNGRMWLEKVRYTKRAVEVRVALNGDEQIRAMRRFLFACRGRLNSFTWRAPIDPLPHTWRLAADAVEIEYRTPLLAYVRLRLIQL